MFVICLLLVHTHFRSEPSTALHPMAKVAAFMIDQALHISTENAFSVFSNVISKISHLICGKAAHCYEDSVYSI